MNSKNIFSTSLEEIKAQLQETIKNEFPPSLAIVFASLEFNLEQVASTFNSFNIQVVGASSSGEIGNKEVQFGGISVLLLDIKEDQFRIIQQKSSYASSKTSGRKLAKEAKKHFSNPAFILMFSLKINGEGLIEGISEELNSSPPIFGGMAGDDMKMVETFTFTSNTVGSNFATALVLDYNKIAIDGMALCGWEPIGTKNIITKSKENIIYEINNELALDVVKKNFGDYYSNKLNEENVPLGAAQYPLQIVRNDSYVLRAALDADPVSGSLKMGGPIKEGDEFRFSVAPGFEVIDETVAGFKKYSLQHPDVDAIIMFSCMARQMSLGPLIEDEIEGIYNVWKKPMAGFFCYGEVGQHGTEDSFYYNETCSLILLKERKPG